LAKNKKQNDETDDDDLRIEINDRNMRKGPHKGFEIASAWNGANLKGHEKEIYYIVDLDAIEENFFLWFDRERTQIIKFFADVTPTLKSIEIFSWTDSKNIIFDFFEKSKRLESNKEGIPWKSIVFLSTPKRVRITASCLSAKIKNSTDDDDIKIVINDHIQPNQTAPTSNKYKNYYFSGNQMKGAYEIFEFSKFSENLNIIQLLGDETPFLERVEIEF